MSFDISLQALGRVQYTRSPSSASASDAEEEKRGILERNSLVWYARGAFLEVFSIDSDFKVISQNFRDCTRKSKSCTIECVEELNAFGCDLIAVVLRLGIEHSQIVLLSLKGFVVDHNASRIDVQEDLKTLRFIDSSSCSIGLLSSFSGCLAVGTTDGKVIMVDLCLRAKENDEFGIRIVMNDATNKQCHIEINRGEPKQMAHNHEIVRARGLYFGLQLSHDVNASVESILEIPPLKACCVGFANGTIIMFDLYDQSIMHTIHPPTEDSAVVAMSFVEPSDDPLACLYLWALYAHDEGVFAFMYMITCEEKYIQQGASVYEQFLSCSPRLNLISYDPGSVPLHVQSISKTVVQEDEPITLNVLSWLGSDGSTVVLVFDLNQWYKAEMPYECDWQDELTHVVVFKLKESSFQARLVERSLGLFLSSDRPEEHFYPNSLAFDIINFDGPSCTTHRWDGIQNKLLQYLDQDGANAIIAPCNLFQVLCRAALKPRFYDLVPSVDDDVKVLREFILSLGLEYNRTVFLHSCVDLWADGSHLGADPERGVSLSTLTDWVWNRSATLKALANRLLVPLLDSSERRVDPRSKEDLRYCTYQMKELSGLYQKILTDCLEFIPENVLGGLKKESAAISVSAEYQQVVQWLLYIKMLPEVHESFLSASHDGQNDKRSESTESVFVPYPYTKLLDFYTRRRRTLNGECSAASPNDDPPPSCELLFIDNLIEREFDRQALRKAWIDEANTAANAAPYPPESLQKALRVLLIPEVGMEPKLALILYLFMDIAAALEEDRYGAVLEELENFPIVFPIRKIVVQRVQALWHLDHGNFETAVEKLDSMFEFPQWHQELAVTVLLHSDAAPLALQVLRKPGYSVSPQLELYTLVQNNHFTDAFYLQRRTPQPDGRQLVWFLEAILKVGQAKILLTLPYNDEEKSVLRGYLRESPFSVSDTLLFGHLLQNEEFVETVQFIDQLSRKRNTGMETQRDILSLYHKALDPLSQRLAYISYTEPKELEPKLSMDVEDGDGFPSVRTEGKSGVNSLSSLLIRNKADFRVRILHHTIVSVREAAAATGLQHQRPFLDKPGYGVFQSRAAVHSSNVTYPIRVEPSKNKRRLHECDNSFDGVYSRYRERQQPRPLLDEDEGYGNPRKRRYLGPEKTRTGKKYTSLDAPVPVIPEFRPMKPKFNFTAAKADLPADELSIKSSSRSPNIFLTTPPLVRKETSQREGMAADSSAAEGFASYTPPGILKSIHSAQSIGAGQQQQQQQQQHNRPERSAEGEEKMLRFKLPPGATLDGSYLEARAETSLDVTSEVVGSVEQLATTPELSVADRPDLDLSGISNDDFYSPEVTIENSSLQQLLNSSGPARRRPLHQSRSSITPLGGDAEESSSSIAIIIEDHEDGEEPSACTAADVLRTAECSAMEVDEGKEACVENMGEMEDAQDEKRKAHEPVIIEHTITYHVDDEVPGNENAQSTSAAGVAQQKIADVSEIVANPDEEDEDEQEEEEEEQEGLASVQNIDRDYKEDDYEVVLDPDEDEIYVDGGALNEYDDDEVDSAERELDEEENSYDDGIDLLNGELDISAAEDGDSEDSSDILEVIDLSDEGEENNSSSSSSSSSSSGGGGAGQQAGVNPADPINQQEAKRRASQPVERYYEEYFSASVPRALFNVEEEEEEEEEEEAVQYDAEAGELVEGKEQRQEENPTSPSDGMMGYIQVPTTSSSTHRAEGNQDVACASGESSEVEDLSFQQQDATEAADSSGACVRAGVAHIRSVAGEQWEDGVASTSGNEETVRATPSVSGASTPPSAAVASSAATSGAAQVSSPAQTPSQTPQGVQQTGSSFGQPKNAHELEVPAMNLSVKPDEAHGSSRKNSKGEENGLSEEARALNLSAGQQELAQQLDGEEKGDNVTSNNESDEADEGEPSTDSAAQMEIERKRFGEERSSQQETSQEEQQVRTEERVVIEEEENADVTLHVSEDEDEDAMGTRTTAKVEEETEQQVRGESGSPKAERSAESEQMRQTVKRSHEQLLQHDEQVASTSATPRSNVKTRLMSAMEKSATILPSIGTPTRRRSSRATSVVQETTTTSLTPTMSRSRRYASMDNVSGTQTPDLTLPQTPRRSTRAASLAKELFAGASTPQKRQRLQSQSSLESATQRGSLPNSPTDAAMEPPEPSEKSFASSTASSIRRGRKTKVPPAQTSDIDALPSTQLSDYSSNRRLTRHQLAVMEKSMGGTIASGSREGGARTSGNRHDVSTIDAGADSESESVVSVASNQSSLRSTRSRSTRTATRRSSMETRSNRGGSKKPEGGPPGRGETEASEIDSDSDISMVSGIQPRVTHGLEPIAEEGEFNSENKKKRRARPRRTGK